VFSQCCIFATTSSYSGKVSHVRMQIHVYEQLLIKVQISICYLSIDTLSAELNPICHLLALLEAHHILHVSRIRVNHK